MNVNVLKTVTITFQIVAETHGKAKQGDEASDIDEETLRNFKKKGAEKQHVDTILLFLFSQKNKDPAQSLQGITLRYHGK